MKLQLQVSKQQKIFTGHGAGYVEVSGQRYTQPVVVTAEEVRRDWTASNVESLTAADFEYFLALRPEVLLLGTGAQQRFPQPQLYRQLLAARIGIECMNTPAACRTYNILLTEGRKVIAAILL